MIEISKTQPLAAIVEFDYQRFSFDKFKAILESIPHRRFNHSDGKPALIRWVHRFPNLVDGLCNTLFISFKKSIDTHAFATGDINVKAMELPNFPGRSYAYVAKGEFLEEKGAWLVCWDERFQRNCPFELR